MLAAACVLQGIGHALYESCVFDDAGQLVNGSLADYLVPMCAEAPDIVVGHVSTPTASSALGAKGAGEAGVTGAPAAVLNAINDALVPFGAVVDRIPATPEVILEALARVGRVRSAPIRPETAAWQAAFPDRRRSAGLQVRLASDISRPWLACARLAAAGARPEGLGGV